MFSNPLSRWVPARHSTSVVYFFYLFMLDSSPLLLLLLLLLLLSSLSSINPPLAILLAHSSRDSKKMGSCASALRKSSDSSSWKHRPSLVHSEVYKHSSSTPTESVKEMTENVDQPITSSHAYTSRVSPFKSVSSFSNYGSKEETFFDSQAWIESDCDDEFYSVKGDFTPSRGSTPLHRSFPGTPLNRSLSSQVNRALFEGRSPPYYNAESNQSSRGSTPLHRSASAATNSPSTEPKKKSMKLGDLFRESIRERQPEESANSDSCISEETQPKDKNLKHAQGCLPRLQSVRLQSARFLKI